jgi:hypothetical protein
MAVARSLRRRAILPRPRQRLPHGLHHREYGRLVLRRVARITTRAVQLRQRTSRASRTTRREFTATGRDPSQGPHRVPCRRAAGRGAAERQFGDLTGIDRPRDRESAGAADQDRGRIEVADSTEFAWHDLDLVGHLHDRAAPTPPTWLPPRGGPPSSRVGHDRVPSPRRVRQSVHGTAGLAPTSIRPSVLLPVPTAGRQRAGAVACRGTSSGGT